MATQSSSGGNAHPLRFEPCAKRVRAIVHGETVAESLHAVVVAGPGYLPAYFFPPAHVRADCLKPSDRRSRPAALGEATHWTLEIAGKRVDDAAWSHRNPPSWAGAIKDFIAFERNKIDHWFEEDEEVFGHPRDPRHRVDVRRSSREVRAIFAGETIALSRRAMFLFETDLPTRYYIPPQDVRAGLLIATSRRTTCPYKGHASYWSIKLGERIAEDAVWAYLDPLPDCPQIKGYFCFYPEKLDRLEVEGESGNSLT
ncbi:MAG TPA: DUF427 domain-containing protein [Stellaceae bacterium]|jgi:uncharacterized protein (DUF427 family)|nr:DUF427 domain-containing protein [Stellaceae bacterium]